MKLFKYFITGGIAGLVDLGLFTLLAKILDFHYLIAGTASFIVATLVNYIISITIVFESGARFKKHHEVMLIYFVSAVGLLINLFFLFVFIDLFNIEKVISKILASCMGFFWNYYSRKHFVFRSK